MTAAQTTSADASRVRTAFNWIGDTKNCGLPPDAKLPKLIPVCKGTDDDYVLVPSRG